MGVDRANRDLLSDSTDDAKAEVSGKGMGAVLRSVELPRLACLALLGGLEAVGQLHWSMQRAF